jgi:hypothetical protein
MKIGLYYRVLIHDKQGTLVKRTRWKESESFVLQFLQHIDVLVNHAQGVAGIAASTKDMGGTSRNLQALTLGPWFTVNFLAVFSADNDATYGVLVGTGTTAVTNVDYKIETLIAHGVGAGQLDYGAHSRTAAQVVGSNVDFVISRAFYNGSGGSITVNEIGISCATVDSGGNTRYFLIVRDVITPVAVANAQTLTVQYTLRTTA